MSKINHARSIDFLDISSSPLVLASRSPARAKILSDLNIPFIIAPADLNEEQYHAPSAKQLVELLALEKAKVVTAHYPTHLIIAADTLIIDFTNNQEIILGKPRNAAHAEEILQRLSNITHKVITGLCVSYQQEEKYRHYFVDSETTYVTFKKLTQADITQYIQSGEAMGKSGAYGIQGKARSFVSQIDGNEDNVIGMPVTLLLRFLKKIK